MAKFFGAIVGALAQLVPPRQVSSALAGPDLVLVRDRIVLAAAATDTVQAAILPWDTVLDPFTSQFSFDDLGTGCTLSLGDITYPNALCNAQDTATAAGTALAMKSVTIQNYFKPLWQTLGYASLAAAQAVGAQCELLFKVNTAGSAGNLVWQLRGVKRL